MRKFRDQIRVTIKGFFSFNKDTAKMKNHLRDFLVQIKEQIGEDTSDLFIEEREQEIQNAQNAKNEVDSFLKFSAVIMNELELFADNSGWVVIVA
ncbi:unnamed protein product [Toxocara canis]|uniref:CRM1_C domain-containing protein n=1 Tax=Toxocara canis TaxID=6265 RepID=A0A183U0A0_TOXCA|nr:unnamed protein product [Toxocara canis]